MSAYPLMIDAASLTALVVGGGRVATRKACALLDAGAAVHVVAPIVSAELERRAAAAEGLRITRSSYDPAHIDGALLVIAATDDDALNARIGADARRRERLVNVVSSPEAGNCVTAAVHRTADVVVAVTAGGAPGAAARIRDRVASVVDDRYGTAVRELSSLRRTLIDRGDRERWSSAAEALVGADFCEQVESGQLSARIREWA